MKHHTLIQGSPEWHAHRREHDNASDTSAVLGCSPYKTRDELLHEKSTGITPDIDHATQRLFDKGHRFEAWARPIAETIIGEELYPVVGSKGKLSASFDGLTMMEDTAFEHKMLNNDLRAVLSVEGCTGADLPMLYQVQMEQQAMVSGAWRVLFMASDWTDDGELIEELHCWYAPNPELAAKIEPAWAQFHIDLAAYVVPEVVIEVVGRAPETLPALHIELTGQVTASNLAEYKTRALTVFGSINRELTTDQHFADAEKTVKWCKDIEDRLAAAKQHALSQTQSIDALFSMIDDISAESARTRLALDKLVKARKEQIKIDIVQEGSKALAQHIAALNVRLGKPYMPHVPADLAGEIKGKKTVSSMRNAVNTELARATIDASAIADKIDMNLKILGGASEFAFLFSDERQIVMKDADDLTLLVKSRIDEHKQREADAATAAAAAATAAASAAIEAAKTPAPAPAVIAPPVAAPAAPAARQAAPVGEVPTLTLGMISARLSFTVNADLLSRLGFQAHPLKNAKLYRESDFKHICAGISAHVLAVAHESMEAAA